MLSPHPPHQPPTMARHHHVNRRVQAQFRRRVLERDGWRCVRCGKASRLEAHHIVPVEAGGDAADPDNGECLCIGCHLAHHGNQQRHLVDPAWAALVSRRCRADPLKSESPA